MQRGSIRVELLQRAKHGAALSPPSAARIRHVEAFQRSLKLVIVKLRTVKTNLLERLVLPFGGRGACYPSFLSARPERIVRATTSASSADLYFPSRRPVATFGPLIRA